jgi:hypothetical protein
MPRAQTDLTAVTERVRRRVIRWLKRQRVLDAAAMGPDSETGCADAAKSPP